MSANHSNAREYTQCNNKTNKETGKLIQTKKNVLENPSEESDVFKLFGKK